MAKLFPHGLDLYISMGTYDDPSLAIHGELCKGLSMPPYYSGGLSSGLSVIKNFGEIPDFRRIIINGPKERLENAIYSQRLKLPQKEIIVLQESKPGNVSVSIDDMIANVSDPSQNFSEFVFIASSDYAKLNYNIANIMFNDFKKSVYMDLLKGVKTEIYMAVGDEIEDNLAYAKVKDMEIDRKGLILGPGKAIRFGNTFLVRSEIVRNKREKIEEIKNHANMRKIKEDKKGAVKYWINQAFTKGKESKVKKAKVIAQAIHNHVNKHYLNSFSPYFTISENYCNTLISDVLGIKFKVVETLGSADFDNDKEHHLASLNGKSK